MPIWVKIGQAKRHPDIRHKRLKIGMHICQFCIGGRKVLIQLDDGFVDLGIGNVLRTIVVHHVKHHGDDQVFLRAGVQWRGLILGMGFECKSPHLLTFHPFGMVEMHLFALLGMHTAVLGVNLHPMEECGKQKQRGQMWFHGKGNGRP